MSRQATVPILALLLVPAGLTPGSESDWADPGAAVLAAVEKSLPYLEKEGQWWIDKKKCISCHHTGYLIWSHRLAASRGIAVDRARLDGW